jgi:hypothetical protein
MQVAALKVTKVGDSVIDPSAVLFKTLNRRRRTPAVKKAVLAKTKWITLHGKHTDAIAYHEGWQYVGYYNGARQVCLARRKLPGGKWEIIRFKDYKWKKNDPHNAITVGIAPGDGTIHMAFDHHVDPLHYRVSKKGAADNPAATEWQASLFGPITRKLHGNVPGAITYPHFWQTPDGGLQFSYRDGVPWRGVTMLVDYDAKKSSWSGTRAVNSYEGVFTDKRGTSESRFGYMTGFVYSPDGKLHNTWVWRENPASLPNHDFMYTYSEDGGRSWFNNAGEKIEGLPKLDTPGIIVKKVPRSQGISNWGGQNVIDSKGRLHVKITHRATDSKERQTFHAWRGTDGKWTYTKLASGGKLAIDGDDNAYSLSLSPSGLVISGATAASGWTDWQHIHTEKGEFIVDPGRAVTYDLYRLRHENVLSVMVQGGQAKPAPNPKDLRTASSALRMIDFKFSTSGSDPLK